MRRFKKKEIEWKGYARVSDGAICAAEFVIVQDQLYKVDSFKMQEVFLHVCHKDDWWTMERFIDTPPDFPWRSEGIDDEELM